MRNYIIRRALLIIPTLFIVTIIIFLLCRFIPGDALDVIQAQISAQGGISFDREAVAHELGLDVPVYVQYGRWISGIVTRGDFGKSLFSRLPVTSEVLQRMPVTLELGILALIIGAVISIPIGFLSALRQDNWVDYITRSFAIIMISVPPFWIGLLIMTYPALWWNWSPPMELIHFTDDPFGNLGMFLLPAFVMAFGTIGLTMRVTRTMMLEVMRQDYIRTAHSKGLTERVVVIRHAAKNALIPVITLIGGQLPMIIGGAVIVEQIFSLPGMGRLMFSALVHRDYPEISAITLLLSGGVMGANLLVDAIYPWLDPRVSYR